MSSRGFRLVMASFFAIGLILGYTFSITAFTPPTKTITTTLTTTLTTTMTTTVSSETTTTLTITFPPPAFSNIYQYGMRNPPPATIEVTTDTPTVPDKIMVYKILYPTVDDEFAANLSKKLDFEDNLIPVKSGETRLVYTYVNSTHYLEISLEGNMLLAWSKGIPPPTSLLSEEQSISLAEGWLKSHGLLIKDDSYRTGVGKYYQVDSVTYAYSVKFTLNINDYETCNEGFVVVVGDGGHIFRMQSYRHNLEPYGEFKLKSPGQALSLLEDYIENGESESKEIMVNTRLFGQLTITEVKLQYLSGKGYLQPVYVFKGVARLTPEATPEGFEGSVDALDRS